MRHWSKVKDIGPFDWVAGAWDAQNTLLVAVGISLIFVANRRV